MWYHIFMNLLKLIIRKVDAHSLNCFLLAKTALKTSNSMSASASQTIENAQLNLKCLYNSSKFRCTVGT